MMICEDVNILNGAEGRIRNAYDSRLLLPMDETEPIGDQASDDSMTSLFCVPASKPVQPVKKCVWGNMSNKVTEFGPRKQYVRQSVCTSGQGLTRRFTTTSRGKTKCLFKKSSRVLPESLMSCFMPLGPIIQCCSIEPGIASSQRVHSFIEQPENQGRKSSSRPSLVQWCLLPTNF